MKKTRVQQYFFMFTAMYHVVVFMAYFYMKNGQYVICVTLILFMQHQSRYTKKESVLLETIISEFHNKYYIPEIIKLSIHLPHVCIIGTHHCGKERHEILKHLIKQHDVLC